VAKGAKRPITPSYVIFFILFAPDTWRIVCGFLLAIFLAPYIVKPEMTIAGRSMLYVMVAAIGWAISGKPARWVTTGLKKLILGKVDT
jgi:hypothetical protein